MDKKPFQFVVICTMLISLFSGFYDLLFTHSLVDSINHYIASVEPQHSDTEYWVFTLYGIFMLTAVLAGFIGLLMFRPWAPAVYLVGYFLSFPAYYFNGLFVSSPTAQILYDFSMMLSGFILALIYFSSLKDKFAKVESEIKQVTTVSDN